LKTIIDDNNWSVRIQIIKMRSAFIDSVIISESKRVGTQKQIDRGAKAKQWENDD